MRQSPDRDCGNQLRSYTPAENFHFVCATNSHIGKLTVAIVNQIDMRAKVAQEKLIKEGPIPYSIIHSTQFYEFAKRIADEATTGNSVRVPPVLFQPIAADDVVSALLKVSTSSPLNGAIEIAGPEQFRFDELVRLRLSALNDPREVIADPNARYFGAKMSEDSLVPIGAAQLGEKRFDAWLKQVAKAASQVG